MSYQWLNRVKADGATVILAKTGDGSIHDFGATSHVATMVNGASGGRTLVKSPIINSTKFDGVDDKVTIPDHADFDVTDPWSIEFVTFPVGIATTMSFLHAGTASATNGFHFFARTLGTPGVEKIRFVVRETAGNVVTGNTGNGSSPRNIRAHWAFVYASAALTIYKNGAVISPSADALGDVDAPELTIGDRSTGTLPYAGLVGPIAIFKSVGLTAAQVALHYRMLTFPQWRGRPVASNKRRAFQTNAV